MLVHFYDEDNGLIKRDGIHMNWPVDRVPCLDETVMLWVKSEVTAYVVDDVITECDHANTTYSVELSSVTKLKGATSA